MSEQYSKEKELELREKELELKRRELELREKELQLKMEKGEKISNAIHTGTSAIITVFSKVWRFVLPFLKWAIVLGVPYIISLFLMGFLIKVMQVHGVFALSPFIVIGIPMVIFLKKKIIK